MKKILTTILVFAFAMMVVSAAKPTMVQFEGLSGEATITDDGSGWYHLKASGLDSRTRYALIQYDGDQGDIRCLWDWPTNKAGKLQIRGYYGEERFGNEYILAPAEDVQCDFYQGYFTSWNSENYLFAQV